MGRENAVQAAFRISRLFGDLEAALWTQPLVESATGSDAGGHVLREKAFENLAGGGVLCSEGRKRARHTSDFQTSVAGPYLRKTTERPKESRPGISPRLDAASWL